MGESDVWRTPSFVNSRSVTFLAVLALHLVLIVLLVLASRTRDLTAPLSAPVEVMFFPPTKVPPVRVDNPRPQRLGVNLAISPELPDLDSPSLAAPSTSADGNGGAVNWAAEARRAVQAFEIRRDAPLENTISVDPYNGWWPKGAHKAGDQYKTHSGDWIVWISADCYQVASWKAGAPPPVPGAQPQTFCPGESSGPRGSLGEQGADFKRQRPRP